MQRTETRPSLRGSGKPLARPGKPPPAWRGGDRIGAETPAQKLETARQEEKVNRSNLGRTEANLRTIRQEEQKTRELIAEYQKSPLCPECGQTVTEEHTQERLKELADKALGLLQLGDSLANDANTMDRRLLGIAQDIRDLEQEDISIYRDQA
jgi:DNA repair exonuclease SbcCD ATPase subunit